MVEKYKKWNINGWKKGSWDRWSLINAYSKDGNLGDEHEWDVQQESLTSSARSNLNWIELNWIELN